MLKRLIFPLLLGVLGLAILLKLGFWQLQRLEWKENLLANIERQITAPPTTLPEQPAKDAHQYLSVSVSGRFGSKDVTVLASTKDVGAIYRIIAPFETDDGRRILVDRGYVLARDKDQPRPGGAATVTGNLLWPDEIDKYTPKPDLKAGIWFARDIPALAAYLETEPVLLVARETTNSDSGITPLPVNTEGIPNNHLEYVYTWFGLALVWAFMTVLLIWRQVRKSES